MEPGDTDRTADELIGSVAHPVWKACAYSPDGRSIVTAAQDGTLTIWDSGSGDPVRLLDGHAGPVNVCAYSPDGSNIISGSDDRTLKLWDASNGRLHITLSGHAGPVRGCTYSPDGKWIASAGADGSIQLWDARTGTGTRIIQGLAGEINACAFNPDGRYLVSGGSDAILTVRDIGLRHVGGWTLEGHTAPVNACAFSPDSRYIVSASSDMTLIVWNAYEALALDTMRDHAGAVTACAWSPDGRSIVSASLDGTLMIWDAERRGLLRTLTGHTGAVNACAYSPTGEFIVSASVDGTLRIWDAQHGRMLRVLRAGSDSPLAPWSPGRKQERHDEAPGVDTDTFTLSIKRSAVRLFARCCLREERAPLWERALDIDWQGEHYEDCGKQCELSDVLRELPNTWGRETVEGFGVRLAELLFGARPDAVVRDALVLEPGCQRRVVLLLDETTFGVPWEYLRVGDRFIAEQALSIVRHVRRVNGPARPLKIARPARISFAYANPGPLEGRFDGDAHRKAISAAIASFCTNIDPAEQCTADSLEGLLRRPSGLFHFLGHGAAGGVAMQAALVLHDGRNGKAECPAEILAGWIRESPRELVVLGACFGAAVPEQRLVAGVGWRIVHESGVPVVAMQMEVPQDFSTAFCARFYAELAAADFDVEVATYMARRAEHAGRHAFGIAVLLADAEGLAARPLPRLSAPAELGWARFERRERLAAGEAGPRWRASDVVRGAAGLAEAIELNARQHPEVRYPEPPASRSELPTRMAELWRVITDAAARLKLEERSARQTVAPALTQPVVVDTVDDLSLRERGSLADCGEAIAAAGRGLSLPDGLVLQIAGELLADKHVLLTGPVGTGKSSLARAVAEAFGYEAQVETASADWTRFEIQGGYWPVPKEKGMGFEFRAGVFLEAVLANWQEQADGAATGRRTWRRQARPGGARGTWLVLDELNRADVDRALGGIFTALETRRLRVPVSEDQRSVDIPIPADFRVIATINAADRHFLFRMSDALKRRFAFVHVPATERWNHEWALLTERERLTADAMSAELRRFVALVRVLHPLGTALVQAALRFLVATASVAASGDWRLTQAIVGSIAPNLEDLRAKRLAVLLGWAETAAPEVLAKLLRDVVPNAASVPAPVLSALAACPREMSPHWVDGDDDAARQAEDLPAWVARRVTRAPGAEALPSLTRALAELVNSAPVA